MQFAASSSRLDFGKASMSLQRRYLNKKQRCSVTFTLTTAGAGPVRKVYLVGDFNNWNRTAKPMKKLKNGTFSTTINLERDREYQFRYLVDGQRWENDWAADKYVPNEYGTENSVVVV